MKKVVLSCFVAILSALPSFAQFNFGGSFNINVDNEWFHYDDTRTLDEKSYNILIKPKIYWNLNENSIAGVRVGIGFGRLSNLKETEQENPEISDTSPFNIMERSIGWEISPFYGHKLFDLNKFHIWAEANVFYSQYYNLVKDAGPKSMKRYSEYGFQILPTFSFDLTDKLMLEIHLGFIALGWTGARITYDDYYKTWSSFDMRKGGFDGLLKGLKDYGIGIVKKF